MANETGQEIQTPHLPEALKHPHTYGVVMPYAQNLKELGDQAGENRLTFYSAFNLNSSYELYKAGHVKKLILCGETTFGEERSTTSDLMKEALLRLGVPEEDIIVLNKPKLDNSAVQIKAVADYQKENGLGDQQFLVIDWRFHDERIKNHIKGFGLNAETVQAEDVHKYLEPGFNLKRLEEILPEEFEEREEKVRKISRFDKRGLIPRLLLIMGRGGSVTDIKKVKDEEGSTHLGLEDTTGKKKLQEYKDKNNPYKVIKKLEAEGQIDSIFSKIIERIRAETNLLAAFDDLGIADNLLKGFNNTNVNGYPVLWGVPFKNVISDIHPASKARGHFDATKKKLEVFFSPPKKRELLEWMLGGEEGFFPGPYALTGLLHEGTHAFQSPRDISEEDEKKAYEEAGALWEAQAYRVAIPALNQDRLIEYVSRGHYGKKFGTNKISYAVRTADRLNALGLTIPKVGGIIQNAGSWDESQGSYPDIESAIDTLRDEKGLSKEDLDVLAVQKIEDARKDISRVRGIALEELLPKR